MFRFPDTLHFPADLSPRHCRGGLCSGATDSARGSGLHWLRLPYGVLFLCGGPGVPVAIWQWNSQEDGVCADCRATANRLAGQLFRQLRGSYLPLQTNEF